MNKKGIMILSSVLCLASLGVAALSSMSNSKLLYADSPKTEAKYTINQWTMVGRSSNYYGDDEFNAGFFFTPATGRKDFVVGIIVQTQSQGTPIDEELTFEQNGPEISYRSYREWYEDTEATPRRYVYQWVVNQIYAFEVARMTYVIGTYNGETYDLDNRPENFSETSVSVYSAFAYTYMDAPGATGSDFNNYHVFDSYKSRTFTPSNPADNDVSYEHGAAYGNDVCVGFKINYATLTLTYSCSY